MRPVDLFYRILNVPMQALLQSPMHGIASRHLCLLTYKGRRSGRSFTTPLSFVRTGDTVRLLSSNKTKWWKNFLGEPADVGVEIGREQFAGRAETIVEDGDRLRDGVRGFLTKLPRDAVVYGIKLDKNKRPLDKDIEGAAGHVVLVEIELDA